MVHGIKIFEPLSKIENGVIFTVFFEVGEMFKGSFKQTAGNVNQTIFVY